MTDGWPSVDPAAVQAAALRQLGVSGHGSEGPVMRGKPLRFWRRGMQWGRFTVRWWDLWRSRPCLVVRWDGRVLLAVLSI